MTEKLSKSKRAAALAELAGWREADGRDAICKTFVFTSFSETFGFMTRSALIAEKLDHHPEWSNNYKTVDVMLTTHRVKGLTALDIELAEEMNRIAGHPT